MAFRGVILALFALCTIGVVQGQTDSVVVSSGDTIHYRYTPIEQTPKRRGIDKMYGYFNRSRSDKPFDVTFVGAPTYSNSTGLGLGVMVAGIYSNDRSNSALPPSQVNLFARATLKGVYNIGLEGSNIFANERHRLLYRVAFSRRSTDFWGVGYTAAVTNSAIHYISNRQYVGATYLYRLYHNIYIGTQLSFDYASARKADREDMRPYLGTRKTHDSATEVALIVQYDSRDFILNAQKGAFVHLQGGVRPKYLGSVDKTSYHALLRANYYQPLWRGAILAFDLYGEYNSATTPWQFYAKAGDQSRMRGYYEGRFMDNNLTSIQVELRQRIWSRLGAVAWGGAANCFGTATHFAWGHTLPTYGVGLRWEFMRGLNLRLDYGFGAKVQGRLINGFTVQLGEAF